MSEFTDYYRIQAANWYATRQMAQSEHGEKSTQYTFANREFETYRKAAGLPENWKPDDETQ